MNLRSITFGAVDAFNVVIEIPQGSNEKFEYDQKTDSLKLNFVFKDLVFPFNYGFIPQTLGGDGDPLDAIVLSSAPLKSSAVIKCTAIGMLKTIDRGEVDDKVVCLPENDPMSKSTFDIKDLPPDTLQNWTQFYMEVARQKKKTMEIIGLENRQEALVEIKNSLHI